jgi:hypothetical protein
MARGKKKWEHNRNYRTITGVSGLYGGGRALVGGCKHLRQVDDRHAPLEMGA